MGRAQRYFDYRPDSSSDLSSSIRGRDLDRGTRTVIMGKTKPITDLRRALMFQVMQGDNRIGYFLMIAHKHPRCDDILHWLVNRGLIGVDLIKWLEAEYKGNLIQAVAGIGSIVEKIGGGSPIINPFQRN